jgi:HTH-type transcriptional regulator / antitoxin HigA
MISPDSGGAWFMTHSMRLHPLRTEDDYTAALAEIAHYFDREPEPGTISAERFDSLAAVIEEYEREHWPIKRPRRRRS